MIAIDDEQLKGLALFRHVNLESIRGLLDACLMVTIPPETVILEPGHPNRLLYLLIEGRVSIHLDSPESEPIIDLGPGESVGEMSIIDHQPASAYVVTKEESVFLTMEEDILWSLVQASHAAACNLLFTLTRRLRHADSVILDDIQLDQEYQHYGTVDALTGLHSRYWFDNALERQMARSSRDGSPISLIMIDVDRFKEFNDHYGHLTGDRILYSVAHIMASLLRPTEMIARYGGDEFVVVLPETDGRGARCISERLREGVASAPTILFGGKAIPHPTISAGVAEMSPGDTEEDLVGRADAALYEAKAAGRNRMAG